ncbi:MAG: glycosyltransferase family 9 protein [Candidatus Omnitrophica bacterium]|nr:glycosyltransferase family 9 protein [Candidatus Omnitrophota bacterium]
MMYFKLSKSLKVEQVLVVSLSNIGDVVLTFPVLDVVHARFPSAEVHVVVGPKAAALLSRIPWIKVIVYNKKMSAAAKWNWFLALRSHRFDLVVDLRNSMLPLLLNAAVVTGPLLHVPKVHMQQKHLARLKSVVGETLQEVPRACFAPEGVFDTDRLVAGTRGYVVVAPGAADLRKRWGEDRFLQVIQHLRRRGRDVVLLGDKQDALVSSRLVAAVGDGVIDLCGKTGLDELMPVIDRAVLAITNDSGIMHLASYANKPTVALFGPTDPFFYGPWSSASVAIRRGTVMESIPVKDVLNEVDKFL